MNYSDNEWKNIYSALPIYGSSPKGGRPRLDKRKIFEGILFVSINKIPWKAAPKIYGSGSTLNKYFRSWAKAGVFHQIKNRNYKIVIPLDWDKVESLYQPRHNIKEK